MVVVLSNYPAPIKETFGTFQSVKSAVEMDCGNHLLRDIDLQFYPRSMAKGKVLYKELGDGAFQAWPAGSLNAILHTVLCP